MERNQKTLTEIAGPNTSRRNVLRQLYHINRYLFPESIKGKRILDVGAGSGTLSIFLHLGRGALVQAVEEDAGHGRHTEAMPQFTERLKRLGLDGEIILHRTDIRSVSFEPFSFDSILMRDVLHHIFEYKRSSDEEIVVLFSRMKQWLDDRGEIVIAEAKPWPLLQLMPSRIQSRFRLFPRGKSPATRWKQCAMEAGFEFVSLEIYLPYRLRWLQNIRGTAIARIAPQGSYVLRMRT